MIVVTMANMGRALRMRLLFLLVLAFCKANGLSQCGGSSLNIAEPSRPAIPSDSIVILNGIEYVLLVNTPSSDDTAVTFYAHKSKLNFVAFYPNGNAAYLEEHHHLSYSRSWFYGDGRLKRNELLSVPKRKHWSLAESSFLRDGRVLERSIRNDTLEYRLLLDQYMDTLDFWLVDRHKGAKPYCVAISSACGSRKEVRFYRTINDRFSYEYFVGHNIEKRGICDDPRDALLQLRWP